MQLITIISTTIAALTASAQEVGPPITAPFNLKVKFEEDHSESYLAPSTHDTLGVYWSFLGSDRPSGEFQLESDALKYNSDGEAMYASAGLYEVDAEVPILQLRDTNNSPKGYDHGYTADSDLKINVNGSSDFWVCDVNLADDGSAVAKVVTFWKYQPLTFPPYPSTKGCQKVDLIVDNIYN